MNVFNTINLLAKRVPYKAGGKIIKGPSPIQLEKRVQGFQRYRI